MYEIEGTVPTRGTDYSSREPENGIKIQGNHLAETACTCLNRLLDDREPHNSLFQVAATHGTGHRSEGPILGIRKVREQGPILAIRKVRDRGSS
jgi:hypothetical protein